MRPMISAMAWVVCASWLVACAVAPPLPPADVGPPTHVVKIVSNGWHTTIVVPHAELIATGLMPEADDFGDAPFLEFGWGDRVYFPAEEETLGMALKAALTATPAVMHVAGLARAPELTYAEADVLSVALTDDGFRRMVRAIAGDFERPEGRRATATSRGLYSDSHFYNAHGTFHLLNTCNTWTARMLRAGGINLSPAGVVTADDVMVRLRAAAASARLPAG